MYLADESFDQSGICCELDCLYNSHKVPMVVIVAVVIAKYATIIHGTAFKVDIREAIGDELAVLKPDLFLKKSPFSLALEAM